jgi:NADH-ubiquinone oxidoreductase chain 3
MTSITFFLFFIPFLAFILLAVNLIFAPHNSYQEKDSAFECGFHSFLGQNRTQFSISFFIFALLFLLFDLEILLVYPYVVSSYSNGVYGLMLMLVFFLALTLGFAFELGKNALKIDSRQMFISRSKNSNITTYISVSNLTYLLTEDFAIEDLITEDNIEFLAFIMISLIGIGLILLILHLNPFAHPLRDFYRYDDNLGRYRRLNDDEMKERLMRLIRGQQDFNLIYGRKSIYDCYSPDLELKTLDIQWLHSHLPLRFPGLYNLQAHELHGQTLVKGFYNPGASRPRPICPSRGLIEAIRIA